MTLNTIYFRGRELTIQAGDNLPEIIKVTESSLTINNYFKKDLHKQLISWIKREARNLLKNRIDDLSATYKLPYKDVRFKNTKSRWGSCTASNIINLNWNLILLPDYITDYILIHELVHTKVKNHSKEFWNYVGTIIPEYRSVRSDLRKWERLTEKHIKTLYY